MCRSDGWGGRTWSERRRAQRLSLPLVVATAVVPRRASARQPERRSRRSRCFRRPVAVAVSNGLGGTINCRCAAGQPSRSPWATTMRMLPRYRCAAALSSSATGVAASLHWLWNRGATTDARASALPRGLPLTRSANVHGVRQQRCAALFSASQRLHLPNDHCWRSSWGVAGRSPQHSQAAAALTAAHGRPSLRNAAAKRLHHVSL